MKVHAKYVFIIHHRKLVNVEPEAVGKSADEKAPAKCVLVLLCVLFFPLKSAEMRTAMR
jgi:hypothetical protein